MRWEGQHHNAKGQTVEGREMRTVAYGLYMRETSESARRDKTRDEQQRNHTALSTPVERGTWRRLSVIIPSEDKTA